MGSCSGSRWSEALAPALSRWPGLALVLALGAACASGRSAEVGEAAATASPARGACGPRDHGPVEVLAIRESAAGHLIDLRYRVVEPERLAAALAGSVSPELVARESGAVLRVPNAPKVGRLGQAPRSPAANRTYFLLFSNPERQVRPGACVELVLGELRVAGLVVQ